MVKSNEVASLLLSPSANLFDKYDYEISIERQRSNIVKKIREREALLQEIHLKPSHFESDPHFGTENELESNFELKEITFDIVDLIVDLEAIRERNELLQSTSGRLFDRNSPRPKLVESFDWFGKSYLLKIIEDSRGLLDNYEFDVWGTDSVSNKNRHTKIIDRLVFEKEIENSIRMQQCNVQVVKTIAGRRHNFDQVVFDVNEYPVFDPGRLVLEDVGAKVIVACLMLLFSKKEYMNDKEILDKKSIADLSKVDLHVLARNIEKAARSTKIVASKRNVTIIYSTLLKYVHQIQTRAYDRDENIMSLQDWLLATIANNYRYLPPLKDDCHDLIASRESTQNENISHTSGDNDEYKEDDESESMDESDEESECIGSNARSAYSIAGKVSMPDPCYVKASEGNRFLVVVKGISQLQEGDQIRVGHPHFSRVYYIEAMEKNESNFQQIYLNAAFDYSSILCKEIADPSEVIEYLHDPKQRFAMKEKERKPLLDSTTKQIYDRLDAETMRDREPLEFKSIRIWKLVPQDTDKRLEWRRQFDNGLVPWHNISTARISTTRFKVKVVVSDIIDDCKDNVTRTKAFPHQQRLDFFEKVQLNLIVKETFETVCKWHPLSKSMDIFKWGKLARKMKFLHKIKNAQHEVDMAFLRHSIHRQLTLEQFYSLLVDMAIMRFPSPKYSEEEALANLLWGTVVMMPQVNTLVWKKAQEKAIVEEIERVCAQTRIATMIRMRKCRAKYFVQYRSIVMIQSCVRCVVAVKLKQRILHRIEEERIRRLHYKSAVLCQKTWRRYKRRAYFLLYKKNRKRMLTEARARRRRKMQNRFRYNLLENIVYRDVTRVHSVPVIVWMLQRQSNNEEKKGLEIQVMIIETRKCFKFRLDRFQMRQCLETVILKRGPLSEQEMMKKSTLSTFVSRISIQKLAQEEPQVSFHRSGIVEKGDLIENSFLERDGINFILSMYRTEFDIVIRLHNRRCERGKVLRVQIPMKLLTEWLLHHEEEQELGCIDYIGAWKLTESKRKLDKQKEGDIFNFVAKEKANIPLLLQKEKEEDLREWLKHRFSISVDLNSDEERITLDFENLAAKAECIAQRLQSVWRRKRSKAIASNEVHLQYDIYPSCL
ncbi:hypothetical protein CTEN210_17956 [Chaetoceros tenuissimus]|uniref:Uncharacterized protein n=1 Tax=Chaetoceros tenuissimus TaxID=426638 RepID=A0AAD3DEF3_9STRA|nr:hypothetical protein CTEN210_17956 [Chaetoceros tenuissimus]